MRLDVLEEAHADGYRLTASVSGFAALRLLRPEAGLHVLEVRRPRTGRTGRLDDVLAGKFDLIEP
jgi:hypothetical protein